MQKVIKMVSFELNSPELLEDWKKLSIEINTDLQNVDGFLERESAQDENGLVYCVVKWADESYQQKFMQKFSASDDFESNMAEFGRIANMETMVSKTLAIF
jgi:hypothetical protein